MLRRIRNLLISNIALAIIISTFSITSFAQHRNERYYDYNHGHSNSNCERQDRRGVYWKGHHRDRDRDRDRDRGRDRDRDHRHEGRFFKR